MINKYKSNKELKKCILKFLMIIFISNFMALSLTNLLYYSNNNQKTNINTSENNLFTTPAEYSTLLSKLNTIDSFFPVFSTSQSTQINVYNGERMYLTSNNKAWLNIYYNGVSRGSIYSNSSADGLVIAANNSSGTEGQGTLNLIGNPVKFNDVDVSSLSSIGTIVSESPTAVSVPNAGYKDIATIQLTSGKWLVSYSAQFATNSTGYREIRFGTEADNNNYVHHASTEIAAPNIQTTINSFVSVQPSTTTVYHFKARQNSGGALNVTGIINAVKIK